MKAFKTRIYPTLEQAELIDKTIGCCRFVYNNGPNCNTQHDRDLNASINILKIALSGREEEPVDTGVTRHLEQENLE